MDTKNVAEHRNHGEFSWQHYLQCPRESLQPPPIAILDTVGKATYTKTSEKRLCNYQNLNLNSSSVQCVKNAIILHLANRL